MVFAKVLVPTTFVLVLQGCAIGVLEGQRVSFENKDIQFSFVKKGCVIADGEFADRSGKGSSGRYFKFIASDTNGRTTGEWAASCGAVAPNGMSSCDISRRQAPMPQATGGLGCPELSNFRVVN